MLKPQASLGHSEYKPERERRIPGLKLCTILTVFLENLLKVWLGGRLHRAFPVCTSFGALFWGRGAHGENLRLALQILSLCLKESSWAIDA